MWSKRFPNKALANFAGIPLLEFLIDRLKTCKSVNKIVLSTTKHSSDDELEKIALKKKIHVFRGKETEEKRDLLGSFIECAEKNDIDIIVRICGDSPLIEPEQVDRLVHEFLNNDYDYLSLKTRNDRPIILSGWGLAVEVISLEAFKKARSLTEENVDLEHVTPFIYKHPEMFKVAYLDYPKMSKYDHDGVRLTVDYKEDLDILNKIAENYNFEDISLSNVLSFLEKNPSLLKEMKDRNNANQKKV